MIFLNGALLIGLAAIAIPILIHLIHRRRARLMDWGAMQFLLRSAAARKRRTIIEELILMALRCLLVVLVATAMARPFLPSTSRVPWALVLPAVLAAAILAAVGAVVRTYRLVRVGLFVLAALLLGGAAVASTVEYLSQDRQWSPMADAQDVAVVLDGSMSMEVLVAGRSNFHRALDEARAVVAALRPADTVTIVLAGPISREPVVGPTSDRALVLAALDTLRAMNGPLNVPSALDTVAAALVAGQNPIKRIVLITDGQGLGWNTHDRARWEFLADGLAQLPGSTDMVCRLLPLPPALANVAVGDVSLSRVVVGSDRPLGIDVRILNTGTVTSPPVQIELAVDGGTPDRAEVGALRPGAAETVRFDHRFDEPGAHVVAARIAGADDLPADDTAVRVVDVLERLPVLVIDGAPSARLLGSPAGFLALAMAPADPDAATPRGRAFLLEPTVIPVTDTSRLDDLSAYRAVVMTNVARLPSLAARAVALFVRDGGGLLVALGDRADPAFYDEWRLGEGEHVMPGTLAGPVRRRDEPARLDRSTFAHPALALLGEEERTDADAARVTSYWRMAAHDDEAVRTGGALAGGDPLLLERKLAAGFVVAMPVTLGRRDSNLPTLRSFVPLVHELIYHLSQPTLRPLNVPPGGAVAVSLSADDVPAGGRVEVATPSGRRIPVTPRRIGDSFVVDFAQTVEPGLYRIGAPAESTEDEAAEPDGAPFVVLGNAQEGFLTPLTAEDLERVRRHLPVFAARTTQEMTAALKGDVPGREVWRQLAACALLVLLAEVAVARWITMQRRTHSATEVDFTAEADDPRRLWDRLRPPGVSELQEVP